MGQAADGDGEAENAHRLASSAHALGPPADEKLGENCRRK